MTTECHYAECRYAECHYDEHCYAEGRYVKCHYAKCHYADCRDATKMSNFAIILNLIAKLRPDVTTDIIANHWNQV